MSRTPGGADAGGNIKPSEAIMGNAETQGQLWGAHPRDWADNEQMCTPFYDALTDAAKVGPDTKLLDLGCGAGTALLLAAKRGAHVAGIDASDGMLAFARERLPGVDLRRGDLESLPYADGSFDVVTAYNSIGFCPDQVAAFREAKRVTAPGGRIGVVFWADPRRSDMRVLFAALAPLHPAAPAVEPVPGEPLTTGDFMTAAGLTLTHSGEVHLPLIYPDLETAVRIQTSSGPAQLAVQHSGAAATRDAIAGAFAGSRQPDGTYRMDNVFSYLVATV
jgi:SAM-dependent methyltransferase